MLSLEHPLFRNLELQGARLQSLQVEALQQELKAALGTKVLIKQGAKERGKIVIHYTSFKEFERLKSAIEGEVTSAGQRAA